MLQYDLTDTPLFDTDASMPTEAEMFIFTAALMLVKDFTYSDLDYVELRLDARSVEAVAECIERHLSIFTHDVGHGRSLRQRLHDFVGMRIASLSPRRAPECRGAT